MGVNSFNDFEATAKGFISNHVEFGEGISINPVWIVALIAVGIIIWYAVREKLKAD